MTAASFLNARFAGALGGFTLDAAFSFPSSGVTALFGPSGCGKTSVLRCFAGLNRLEDGAFSIHGEVWQDRETFLPPHRRAVGYVFQEANLFPHMSVKGNLDYGRKRAMRTTNGAADAVDFDALVALLGLEPMLGRLPGHLSGGERQRVAMARALLTNPKLLLMDEPLSALDHGNKKEILPYLERLHQGLNIPVLYVTHAPDEVARLADHIVLMDAGRVVASGPVTETMARLDLPMREDEDAGVAVKARIAEVDARWHLARAEFAGGSFWLRDPGQPPGTPVRLLIRSRDVSIGLAPSDSDSILNRLPANVTEVVAGDHPSTVLVGLDLGGTPITARLTARSAAHLELAPGKAVWAQIKSVAMLE